MTEDVGKATYLGSRPDSPLSWISYMEQKLTTQESKIRRPVDYYDNNFGSLTFAQTKFREVFGDLFIGWQDNFCQLIVDSISERLRPQGFRFSETEQADEEANKIWQRSSLDADSNAAHIEALVTGSAYLCVWHDDNGDPVIIPESASEVVVQYAPGSRRKVIAAYKRYYDDWGARHATLWLEDYVYTANWVMEGVEGKWTLAGEPEENYLGIVPVVPLMNRSRLKRAAYSELDAIMPVQDAINKVTADAIVASEFAAYPQRIITGLEPLDESATPEQVQQERVRQMKAYIDRILEVSDPDVKWGQFDPADLGNYVKLIDMLVQHMASRSRVPFHYFLLNGGQAPSGESITAAEAGLVAKARERMLHFGESWEMAMRIAFLVQGDQKRYDNFQAEMIWGDPEHRSKNALADQLMKQKGFGVPDRQLQEDFGYSPQTIKRFAAMIRAQQDEEIASAKRRQEAGVDPVPGEDPKAGGKPTPDAHSEKQLAQQKSA